ncbi:MAG: hypothetical protein IJ698_09040, partial [Prevotella sp.]|nr:hypothetical protein [Prevotella sp.]
PIGNAPPQPTGNGNEEIVLPVIPGDEPVTDDVPCEVTTVDYCGDFIYINGVLKRMLFSGGYVTFRNDSIEHPEYHFYLTDHQGNIRVVANQNGEVEQVNHYYPYGGLMGESTNSEHQPYKYNGKELDRHHGLDWMDYGARWYNGYSWTTPDPHAESYYDVTPYGYCHDNPMNKIDPNGKDDYKLNTDGYLEFWRKSNSKTTDRIYTLDGKSNITINKTTTKQLIADRDDYDGNYAVGGAELQDLFKFCSDNSNVEWRLNGYKDEGKTTYLIATTHDEGKVKYTNGGNNELDLFVSIHSHPSDSPAKASGYGKNSEQNGKLFSTGDDQFTVNNIYNQFKDAGKAFPTQYPRFYIYHTKTQTRIGYDPDKPRTSVKKIRKVSDLIP